MHHFWYDEKLAIYRKILGALKPGGSYIEGDFMVDEIHAEQYKKRYEQLTANLQEKAKAGEYHIDIPFTLETQEKLLLEAGFGAAEVLASDIKEEWSYGVLAAAKN
jgi:tRNA (cmo5U34)-methyltransferase